MSGERKQTAAKCATSPAAKAGNGARKPSSSTSKVKERAGCTWLADNWSIGIRRIGKLALGSVLCPRSAARIESRVWLAYGRRPEETGDERVGRIQDYDGSLGVFP